MASESAEPRPIRGRLHTTYWLLLTTLFGLPLITPLLHSTAVACTHDGHLHYHRVATMAHAWGNGIFLTRWLPDLAFGYGYPFFVYREAAPLYAVLLPHLAGLPLPAASNLFYAVTILLCGVFMFLWVRDLFGEGAALVSAVAYMAAPYVLVDALVRGNAPESLALPLFPFLLWVGRRWVLFGSVRAFLAGVLGLALLSISHNISTFIFAPTLLVYLIALALFANHGSKDLTLSSLLPFSPAPPLPHSPALTRAILLVLLGLSLAFFYTGGALLEMDQVTLEMSTTTRNNDWRYNFASVGEILSPVAAENPALLNPPLLFRLGWVPLLLAAGGLTGLLWLRGSDGRAREQRLHIWLMALGVAIYLFMALPISRWLWEALPLIDFVQFPWRFVGRAALPVAFLAGVPFYWLTADRRRPTAVNMAGGGRRSAVSRVWSVLLPAIAAALLVIETIPNLYPRLCEEEPFPTILTVHAYERATGLVGVDPEGSYFPRTVRERPDGSPLEADYGAGRTPQRFDITALPPAAEARDVAYDRFGVTLTVDSPQPFTARYLSFAFPGWSARVDGAPVSITPEDPTGLITFAVPAGTHAIAVDWGITPLRAALVGVSLLAAVGVGVVVARERRPTAARRRPTADDRPPAANSSPPSNDQQRNHDALDSSLVTWSTIGGRRSDWLILILAGALMLTGKLLVDRVETPLRRVAPPLVEQTAALQGGELRLDGFNLSRTVVPAGGTFDVDMAWTAVAPPAVDYQSELSLVGPDGLAWSQKGTERPRAFEDAPPTRQWSPGAWGWDSREVRVLDGTPPGIYDIEATLFDKATLAPVTLADAATGQPIGPAAVIGQIEIVNPTAPPAFAPQYAVEHDFPVLGLRLLGYNLDRAAAAPGDSVLLTFFWECAEPSSCQAINLTLQDESGAEVAARQLPAVREGFPTEAWPAHGRLRGQHLVRLPANLESGQYRLFLEDFPLGEIAVTAPPRQFSPPPLAQSLDATFTTPDGAPVTTLVGLAESPLPPCSPAPLLSCPLIWRAEAESSTGYHVFVHLVDEAGNILAQSDGVPGQWARPTTGWLPGEYVLDMHTLALPAEATGTLSVRVGLYDPATGQRLQTAGGEFATIPLP